MGKKKAVSGKADIVAKDKGTGGKAMKKEKALSGKADIVAEDKGTDGKAAPAVAAEYGPDHEGEAAPAPPDTPAAAGAGPVILNPAYRDVDGGPEQMEEDSEGRGKKKIKKRGKDEEVIVEDLGVDKARFKYCAGSVSEINAPEGREAGRADYHVSMEGGVKTRLFAYNMQWDSSQPDANATGVGPKGGKRMAIRATRKWFKLRNRKKLRRQLLKALAVMDSQASRTVFMRALTSEFKISRPPCGTGCGWAWRPYLRWKLFRRRKCAPNPLERAPPLEHGHTHIVKQRLRHGKPVHKVSRSRVWHLWLCSSVSQSKRAELQRLRRSAFRRQMRRKIAKRMDASKSSKSKASRFFAPCTDPCRGESTTVTATFPNPHFVERDPNFPDVLRPTVSNKLLRESAGRSGRNVLLTETNKFHRSAVHKKEWSKPLKTRYVMPTKGKKAPNENSIRQDTRELGTPAVYRKSKMRYVSYRPTDLWGRRNRTTLVEALVSDLRIRAGIPSVRRCEFLPEQVYWSRLHSVRDDTVPFELDMLIRTMGPYRPNSSEGVMMQENIKNRALDGGILDAIIALLEDQCGDDALYETGQREKAFQIAVKRKQGLRRLSREGATEYGFYTVASPDESNEVPRLWCCRVMGCRECPGTGPCVKHFRFCPPPLDEVDLRCLRETNGATRCYKEVWDWQYVQIDEMCMCLLRGLTISHLHVDSSSGISEERCKQIGNFFIKYPRAVALVHYYTHDPIPSRLPKIDETLCVVGKKYSDPDSGVVFYPNTHVGVRSGMPDFESDALISVIILRDGRKGQIPQNRLKEESNTKAKTPNQRLADGEAAYGWRLKDEKTEPYFRPRVGAPTATDWIRFWANMLSGGSHEFKAMIHHFYPRIYTDVITHWWVNYVEKGVGSTPPKIDYLEFGLRQIGDLFRANEFVADLSNGYHRIRTKSAEDESANTIHADGGAPGGNPDLLDPDLDDNSVGGRGDALLLEDEFQDIEAEAVRENRLFEDGTNIIQEMETLFSRANEFEDDVREAAQKVIMGFYARLAQASTVAPLTGQKLQRILRGLRQIKPESVLGNAGLHATMAVLHLNGEYTEHAPQELHEKINTKANNLAKLIPYTAKVYETNQLPSIERTPLWAKDAFSAVAEGLKAPIVRRQLASEDILGTTFRFLSIIYQNEAAGNERVGMSGSLVLRRNEDKCEALGFLASAIMSFHSPVYATDVGDEQSSSKMFFKLHQATAGGKRDKPDGLNDGQVILTDKRVAQETVKKGEYCHCTLGRLLFGKGNPEIQYQRQELKKMNLTQEEREAKLSALANRVLAADHRDALKPGMVKFIRADGAMNIERILDHFIMDATTRKERALALIAKTMIWIAHRDQDPEGWPMWMVLPGLGRNVSSAKSCSIKEHLKGQDLSINSWVYSDIGAILRDYDFSGKCIRLDFADCPSARTPFEVATFPAASHVASIEAHLSGAIRRAVARDPDRWGNLEIDGMVQVDCTAQEDVGVLGTCHVCVRLMFPAVTVMVKESRLARIEEKFVEEICEELGMGMSGDQGRVGSQFLPFGAQDPPIVRTEVLPGRRRHVDTLICAPLTKHLEAASAHSRDPFSVRPRKYVTRAMQERAASFIIKRWRAIQAQRRTAAKTRSRTVASVEARYAKIRAEAMYKRSEVTAEVACQRVAEAVSDLVNAEIELLPPTPSSDDVKEAWEAARTKAYKPERPLAYRCVLENQSMRRRAQGALESEPPNPQLQNLHSVDGNVLEYVKQIAKPSEASFAEADGLDVDKYRDPLGVFFQSRGMGHPERISQDLAGVGAGGQFRPRTSRTAQYWRVNTKTPVARGGEHMYGGMPLRSSNDMFTIMKELLLEQAEVEALRHRRWKLLRGGDADRVVSYVKDSCSVGSVSRVAAGAVRESTDTDIYKSLDKHVTQYLDASGVHSPLMLWSLAADIPPDDEIYSGISNDMIIGGVGGRLLVPLAVQDEGKAAHAILELEQDLWINHRSQPAHRNGIKIDDLAEQHGVEWVSAELQYIHGLRPPANARRGLSSTNKRSNWGSLSSKSRQQKEWRTKRETVKKFAPRWYDVHSLNTSPRDKKHRLAPFERWCPWEVTAKLDKYIQKKALSLMHEALGKCDEMYSMYMDLNKSGMFVCGKCLVRDCKVERDLFDRELVGQGAFSDVFVAYPKVQAPEQLFIYEGDWIDNARFVAGIGVGGCQGGKIAGHVKWQSRGRERNVRDPTLGGTVWARTYGKNERKNIWIRHPKADPKVLLEDFHTPLHERDFRVLIPCNVSNARLRQAIATVVKVAGSGIVQPTGVIFRAKYTRSTRQQLVHEALVEEGRPMAKAVPWDARTGYNQSSYKEDAKADDLVELEFEQVYYVVRKAHEESFREVGRPYPQCHACWVTTGAGVSAPYFSRVATSEALSLGPLNPNFSIFYADPHAAYAEMLLPAILNHPSLPPDKQLLLQQKAEMLANWGAFSCGELLNPHMNNTGTKNVMNLSMALKDTKNGRSAARGGRKAHSTDVETMCQCRGRMHKCEKYLTAMALVRYVTSCREFKIRIGSDPSESKIIHPVMLVETNDKKNKYQWSISDGCTRDSGHAMMHLYETLTAARTCKYVVPVTEDDCFSEDPEAVFQLLAALDRETFAALDEKNEAKRNAVPTVISIALDSSDSTSDRVRHDTRTLLLNSCFNKDLVDRIAPPEDAAFQERATPWYDYHVNFLQSESQFSPQDNVTLKRLQNEKRRFHTLPSQESRFGNDVQYSTFRKWLKQRRTLTLHRPDMIRPVKVAIHEAEDLQAFHHAELTEIYKVGWERIPRVEIHATGRKMRQYELRFLCDSISSRQIAGDLTRPFWDSKYWGDYGISGEVSRTVGVDGQYKVKECLQVGNETVQHRDLIVLKRKSDDRIQQFIASNTGDGLWTITEIFTTTRAAEIDSLVKGCFGDVKKKVPVWQEKFIFNTARVEPFTITKEQLSIATLVVQVHTADDHLGEKGQLDERTAVRQIQERLMEQLNGGPRSRIGGDLRLLSTLPYCPESDSETPSWRMPRASGVERECLCPYLLTVLGKRFELPQGQERLQILGEYLRQGDCVLTGCGSSDGEQPRIFQVLRVRKAETPGEPTTAEMVLPSHQQIWHKDDKLKALETGKRDFVAHGFVQGGTNKYAGKFVKLVGNRDEIPAVETMTTAHVLDQWSQWRSMLISKLKAAEAGSCPPQSIGEPDVIRPAVPLGATTVMMKFKTIQIGSAAYDSVVQHLTTQLDAEPSPFKNMKVVRELTSAVHGHGNPFQSNKRVLQEVLWKPMSEIAAIIRGATMASELEVEERPLQEETTVLEPARKRHTVKMVLFTKIKPDGAIDDGGQAAEADV